MKTEHRLQENGRGLVPINEKMVILSPISHPSSKKEGRWKGERIIETEFQPVFAVPKIFNILKKLILKYLMFENIWWFLNSN